MANIKDSFHVCINVYDFDKSLAFYKALGFTDKDQLGVNTDKIRMQYLLHKSSGSLVELIQFNDGDKRIPELKDRKDVHGLNHFGFFVDDLDAMREKLVKQGVTIVEDASGTDYDFLFAVGPDNELIGFACMH